MVASALLALVCAHGCAAACVASALESSQSFLLVNTQLQYTQPTQIVIVGASDTGLSCLESLLTDARHAAAAFTHLTLLSPGGLAPLSAAADAAAAAGVSGLGAQQIATPHYPPAILSKLGLEGSVAVVDGVAAGLDREARLVVLGDGRALPYDILVIATGLQVRGGPGSCCTACIPGLPLCAPPIIALQTHTA